MGAVHNIIGNELQTKNNNRGKCRLEGGHVLTDSQNLGDNLLPIIRASAASAMPDAAATQQP